MMTPCQTGRTRRTCTPATRRTWTWPAHPPGQRRRRRQRAPRRPPGMTRARMGVPSTGPWRRRPPSAAGASMKSAPDAATLVPTGIRPARRSAPAPWRPAPSPRVTGAVRLRTWSLGSPSSTAARASAKRTRASLTLSCRMARLCACPTTSRGSSTLASCPAAPATRSTRSSGLCAGTLSRS
ncbi:hypothetical protein BU14_0159s0029 [Porphyra umbilicalis]|uniref:Uncharacterized protein n=1 Tax=Porphyra umbilicalis TaxID=2786 RepID=A0A1X6P8J0_PORUM|nr:hypothetical protein BU14_0159s0029 [Porphyra umbilicalis]|eukprot:OSX77174.1 hypothetical protein BU14_0159s0029 [Porphyra umbilicalis]